MQKIIVLYRGQNIGWIYNNSRRGYINVFNSPRILSPLFSLDDEESTFEIKSFNITDYNDGVDNRPCIILDRLDENYYIWNYLKIKQDVVAFTGTSKIYHEYFPMNYIRTAFENSHVAIHGGCVGADDYFNELCKVYNKVREIYPGKVRKEFQGSRDADLIRDEEPPLIRNRLMVDRAKFLIALPKTVNEEMRSGTWATIRYAFQKQVPTFIFPAEADSDTYNIMYRIMENYFENNEFDYSIYLRDYFFKLSEVTRNKLYVFKYS